MQVFQRGEMVGPYLVERVLGTGSQCTVYGTRNPKDASRQAIKVLNAINTTLIQRMQREGEVLAKLSHENIVGVRGVVNTRMGPGLVLERIDGPSLAAVLGMMTLTEGEALGVIHAVLSGIEKAHAAGYVHRDLKPSNVLLRVRDNEVVPKLADFGLAKVLVDPTQVGITMTGALFGTAHYMAPEQLHDSKDVDGRVDLYVAGVMLYEMVCGRPPFDGAMLEVIAAREDGIYPDPLELAPDLSERTAGVIRRLLEASPDDRPANARQVMDLLGLGVTVRTVRGNVADTARAIRDGNRTGQGNWVKKAQPKKVESKAVISPVALLWVGVVFALVLMAVMTVFVGIVAYLLI